eukprot:TRINITY_DN8313_c1_g1_i1.p1 TRINITY_DN8313_c1_g1~~TRINITY_DN8313_c1_g1_i1.p1  ORF type:complete len:536 (+),score=209.03 TRINITY_DN8313_c1_g1_i1:126-1733(+)
MTRKPEPNAWLKNHPLEGDGLLTGFYNHMWKKNKEFKSCEDVRCPDTIVYDHNFPRGWYTYDKKNKELVKKQGKELDTSTIAAAFSRQADADVGIVASYMYSYEDPETSEAVTSVEFFNERGLHEFVNRKVKKEGILQRFLVPKGTRNSVIQAVWSPRVTIVQRKTNVRSLKDKAETQRDPYSCAVTYEGPSHYSEDGTCAAKTTAKIKKICFNIVDHFYNTEHKHITRMVLYFKVDVDDEVWLLWCGSVRVSDRAQPSKMPLNLSPIFTSPAAGGGPMPRRGHGDSQAGISDGDLMELDCQHSKLQRDPIFFNKYVASPRSPSPRRSPRTERRRRDDAGGGDKDDEGVLHTDEEKAVGQQLPGGAGDAAWYSLPGVAENYKQVCLEREIVLGEINDVFYEAYSHFLKHDAGPHIFTIDRRVSQLLTLDALQELMAHLRIEHAQPPDDMPTGMQFDEELSFVLPADGQTGPITRVGEDAEKWVRAYYTKVEQRLRAEALQMRKALSHEHSEPVESDAAAEAEKGRDDAPAAEEAE